MRARAVVAILATVGLLGAIFDVPAPPTGTVPAASDSDCEGEEGATEYESAWTSMWPPDQIGDLLFWSSQGSQLALPKTSHFLSTSIAVHEDGGGLTAINSEFGDEPCGYGLDVLAEVVVYLPEPIWLCGAANSSHTFRASGNILHTDWGVPCWEYVPDDNPGDPGNPL